MTTGNTPGTRGQRRIGVIGAGIVGLATAQALQQRDPDAEVLVFDKEAAVAQHQTGRNSGVVHAGLYYPKGSLKAELCVEGVRRLRDYCQDRGIAYDACGKVVVALDDEEAVRLRGLFERAVGNGVPGVELLEPAAFQEIEPHAVGTLALHSPNTAIVDYAEVTRHLAIDVEAAGGTIHLGTAVRGIRPVGADAGVRVLTDAGIAELDAVVNCAGLHADRVAQLAGDDAEPRIVPFRGEYYQLTPSARGLVNGLIYPVPDPRYPFLGVHLTKRIDGEVLIGPNAVLAMAREGYDWRTLRGGDLMDIARWPGMWRLAGQHWRTGADEVLRSLSTRRFVEEARRYVPALTADDVIPSVAGVRAQAVDRDGSLVDDFRISWQGRVASVRNAPSPAATSSLAIGSYIAERVLTGAGR
ncbi:MAG: L-2-hydroxyglutarate oxidase [Nitriliruptor sp.]|nr:MAG: L-2-hydroxyglutarate oxidase [Nitriliruptor sp.]